jgi:hypothetical protein
MHGSGLDLEGFGNHRIQAQKYLGTQVVQRIEAVAGDDIFDRRRTGLLQNGDVSRSVSSGDMLGHLVPTDRLAAA